MWLLQLQSWVSFLLHTGPFTLHACQRDSFGRLLGVVTRDGHDLADDLLEAGLAVPYSRKK